MEENPRSEAARLMGRVKSDRKAAAARENGKRGGRPRKVQTAETPESTMKDYPTVPTAAKSTFREIACQRCDGRGWILKDHSKCVYCAGTGKVKRPV